MSEPPISIDVNNVQFVERLLNEFLRDPGAVPPDWQEYFREHVGGNGDGWAGVRPPFARRSIFNPAGSGGDCTEIDTALRQERVSQLIRAYRVRGHLVAKLDPLGRTLHAPPVELELDFHGLSADDLDRPFAASSIGGPQTQTLREIVERLRTTYCRSISVQFMHIDELAVRDWLVERMERTQNRLALSREEQLRILTRLTDAVIFEQFVRKKYVGAKTFSLEGAESLIPLLHLTIEKAGAQGIEEIVMGMAHRGRLNVLANIIGKSPRDIFWEFEDRETVSDNQRDAQYSGDVKYHLGASGDWQATGGQKVHLSLCFNPSHLQFVHPSVLGRTRAKQDRAGDTMRRRGLALVIHGDAGFAGQGVVQEALNHSALAGYTVGGALHVIVNNQLGFTTGPVEGRSTTYATDVARMLQVPVFHVNGEDPEAVAQTVTLAMDFRERFARDVVIDMYCYRRWGHNEGDEPSFTQPVMYKLIEQRPSVRDTYLERLLTLGGVTREEADAIAAQRHEQLQRDFERAREPGFAPEPQTLKGVWSGYVGGPQPDEAQTSVLRETLASLLRKITEVPDGFHLHPKLKRMFERRRKMAEGAEPLDWSAAEALAIASLAVEGHRVRLAGQDTARGTFSQRHAVLHDAENDRKHEVFQHLATDQAPVEIINSPLSETASMGFDYGYSLDFPEALVAWEAQFGDFVNAGQVIVDQFIASAEDKWRRLSGLVLLLPHGFEGQGPEHSSARLERFLTLAGEANLQVVNPTTPAQYFHLLRRQVKRRWRKPLVVMTPKSLLRHPRVVSQLDDLAMGRFQEVLDDGRPDMKEPSRVLLCSGKVYYDLVEAREAKRRDNVAIVRVEQFYPVPEVRLREVLSAYPEDTPMFWVQEEPANMGALPFWRRIYGERFLGRWPYQAISRSESASPATGSATTHKREQQELVERALAGNDHQSLATSH